MNPSFQELEQLARVPMKTESEMRMVEIIMLKYKAPEVEVECLRRIVENTEWPYRLVAYDNRANTANTSRIWNKLIREATCDYVLVIDSDAYVPKLTPCWLTRMMSTFDEYPECEVVITVSNEPGGEFQQRQPVDRPAEPYRGIFAGFCFLIRKSVLDTVGWFDEEFYFYGGDSEWAARFLSRPGSVYIRPDVYVEHLQHYSLEKAQREEPLFDTGAERQFAVSLYLKKTGKSNGSGPAPSESFRAIERLAGVRLKTEREMGMVEIIVLKYKAPEVEVDCIRRIIENTGWPYKLVIYDNRLNTANTSRIWNKLIQDSTCDYVMFLDSDAFAPALTPCWLSRMMSTFESFPACQVVVPVSDNVGGDYQCRPAENDAPAEEYHGQFSGFCFLFRKAVIETIGWFDEEFYFYGADSEWAARFLRRPAAEVYLRPDVFVQHLASYSLKKSERDEAFDGQAERDRAGDLHRRATAWMTAGNFQKWCHPAVPMPRATGARAAVATAAVRLNLSCGRGHRTGWINCDATPSVLADVYFDIRQEIPFPDSCADELYINGVLAQIEGNEDFVHAMNECRRVLKDGARFVIEVPCARYPGAFRDPFDVRRFTEESWDYLRQGHFRYTELGRSYGFDAWDVESATTNDAGIMTVILRKPPSRSPEQRPKLGVSRAWNRLKVAVIGNVYPSYELACPHWNGIQHGLNALEIPFVYVSSRTESGINQRLCLELEGHDPDLIVYGLLDVIQNPELARRVREKFPRAIIGLWFCDLRNEETGQYEIDCRDMLDVLFVSNDGQRDYYRRKLNLESIHFLPQGCTPIDRPRVMDEHRSDFVFIGGKSFNGPFRRRAEFIDRLETQDGLKRIDGINSAEREQVYQAMPAIYSSSKISLDISHFWDIPKYTSVRYWEIPAFCGFPLTRRFPGCEEFYEDRVHRVYFDSMEECIDLKDYYLRHEFEREKIRRAGWEHSHRHTYKERFQQMFRMLEL